MKGQVKKYSKTTLMSSFKKDKVVDHVFDLYNERARREKALSQERKNTAKIKEQLQGTIKTLGDSGTTLQSNLELAQAHIQALQADLKEANKSWYAKFFNW